MAGATITTPICFKFVTVKLLLSLKIIFSIKYPCGQLNRENTTACPRSGLTIQSGDQGFTSARSFTSSGLNLQHYLSIYRTVLIETAIHYRASFKSVRSHTCIPMADTTESPLAHSYSSLSGRSNTHRALPIQATPWTPVLLPHIQYNYLKDSKDNRTENKLILRKCSMIKQQIEQ